MKNNDTVNRHHCRSGQKKTFINIGWISHRWTSFHKRHFDKKLYLEICQNLVCYVLIDIVKNIKEDSTQHLFFQQDGILPHYVDTLFWSMDKSNRCCKTASLEIILLKKLLYQFLWTVVFIFVLQYWKFFKIQSNFLFISLFVRVFRIDTLPFQTELYYKLYFLHIGQGAFVSV